LRPIIQSVKTQGLEKYFLIIEKQPHKHNENFQLQLALVREYN
jgi:hypothetical protein